MFIAAQFTVVKLWNQSICPSIDEQIKKIWYMYTMESYSPTQKNKIMAFVGKWMKMEIILREITQIQKIKDRMFFSHV